MHNESQNKYELELPELTLHQQLAEEVRREKEASEEDMLRLQRLQHLEAIALENEKLRIAEKAKQEKLQQIERQRLESERAKNIQKKREREERIAEEQARIIQKEREREERIEKNNVKLDSFIANNRDKILLELKTFRSIWRSLPPGLGRRLKGLRVVHECPSCHTTYSLQSTYAGAVVKCQCGISSIAINIRALSILRIAKGNADKFLRNVAKEEIELLKPWIDALFLLQNHHERYVDNEKYRSGCLGLVPTEECTRCNSDTWSFISISPNNKAAKWKCKYCNRTELLKAADDSKDDSAVDQPDRRISNTVRREVWRRDEGKCKKCGSRNKLEYDHIIPVSKGGSNTVRNIEILCEHCNRSKGDKIC